MTHPNTAAVNEEIAAVTRTEGAPSGPDTYYPKFRVIRRSTGDEIDPATTFTLLPNKDEHAKVALAAYCDSVESDAPGLAKALREHFNLGS